MTDLDRTPGSTAVETALLEINEAAEPRFLTAQEMLVAQFALAHAPITGRSVGCVLETESGTFVGGSNFEQNDPVQFTHAEVGASGAYRALAGAGLIRTVYMAGRDPLTTGQKYKNICPCSDCYRELSPDLADSAQLVLFEPTTLERALTLESNEYRQAYGKYPYSALAAVDYDEIMAELHELTPLNDTDRAVVADLRLIGLESGTINFYLTGTSSGRGWMSGAINKKLGHPYGDVDILAVSDTYDAAYIRRIVGSVLGEHYGRPNVAHEEIRDTYWVITGRDRGTKRPVRYDSFFAEGRKIMDLSVASSLQAGMLRDDYLDNNCYHKVA